MVIGFDVIMWRIMLMIDSFFSQEGYLVVLKDVYSLKIKYDYQPFPPNKT